MTRVLALLVCLLIANDAFAQGYARGRAPTGEVTGVELGIEGSRTVVRGSPARLFVRAHDVLGLDRLRPSAHAKIQVFTPLHRGGAALEVEADAGGAATLELPIPADAPRVVPLSIHVLGASNVTRRFDLALMTIDSLALALETVRPIIPLGGTFRVWGRAVDRRTGRGRSEPIELTPLDEQGRPLAEPTIVRSDDTGAFAYRVRLPRDIYAASIRARYRASEDDPWTEASVSVSAQDVSPQPLIVQLAPAKAVARPGESVPVEIVVRTAVGEPVEGATVQTMFATPVGQEVARTDRRGRTSTNWIAPGVSEPFVEMDLAVVATRAGVGAATGSTHVGIAGADHRYALAVEGGALPVGIPRRFFVRVADASGHPVSGVAIEANGPRVGAHQATTDASGVATFDATLGAPGTSDACGGEGATAVQLSAAGDAQPTSLCAPVDPDALLTVRAPARVLAGQPIHLEVQRGAASRALPVLVRAVSSRPDRPDTYASILIPANTAAIDLPLPADAIGTLQIRARALFGAEQLELRGAATAVSVVLAEPATGDLAIEGETLTTSFPGTTYAVALPLDEARELERRIHALGATGIPVGSPLGDAAAIGTDALQAAELAARTLPDLGAPAVLRGGVPVAVPAPDVPEQQGLLRDPFRIRARFVAGRLGLLMRAIEAQVAASLPAQIDRVARRDASGRFSFNREIVGSLDPSTLGDGGGATGLGGAPLSIAELERLDPELTYDNVARRITRQRLFDLVLALRALVQERGLDLAWTWTGDPREWLVQLAGRYTASGNVISGASLVDGWGRPFELRPSARPRFDRVVPVPGHEIVSAGPDGRFDTGDDVWNPLARVLRSGGVYAVAVGEDELVARLEAVDLGRRTIESVLYGGIVPVGDVAVPPPSSVSATPQAWPLPPPIELDSDALALRRPAVPTDGVLGRLGRDPQRRLVFEAEPRTWGVVAWSTTDAMVVPPVVRAARGGSTLVVSPELPTRLFAGEPLAVDLTVTNVGDRPASYRVAATGIARPSEPAMQIPAGESRRIIVELTASQPGEATAGLTWTEGERRVRAVEAAITVQRGLHPIRRRASGFVAPDGSFETELEIPDDAIGASGRLVLVAPRGVPRDPEIDDARRDDPALPAFGHVLVGSAIPADLRARLLRAQASDGSFAGDDPRISTAAAIAALASLPATDEQAHLARYSAIDALIGQQEPQPYYDEESYRDEEEEEEDEPAAPDPKLERTEASIFLALASLGVPESATGTPSVEGEVEPLAIYLAQLRQRLRRMLRAHPGDPGLLARAAAGLLVASPRDLHGRAMLDRALRATHETAVGRLVRPAEPEDHREALVASLALALAAHQVGRREVAAELVRAVMASDSAVLRGAADGLLFWMAAAGYGLLGSGQPVVHVEVDGEERSVEFDHGVAQLPLDIEASGEAEVEVEVEGGAGVLVRVETAFGRPFAPARDAPLGLQIDGDPGRFGGAGAFELLVRASAAVRQPTIDVQLPAGVDADKVLGGPRSSGNVRSAELRSPGFLRIVLTDFTEAGEVVVPLGLVWTARGEMRGLGAVAYPAAEPARMTVLPPRMLRVAAEE